MPLASLMLILRVGQALYFAGLVRSKNASSSAMRLLLDLAIVLLGLWAIGMGFLPMPKTIDDKTIFDWHNLMADSGKIITLFVLVFPIILVATGAVCGAILERTRIAPLLVFSTLASIIMPMLFQLGGLMGYAGSGMSIAMLFAGPAALIAAKLAGPRKGKYNRDLSVNFIPGHNVSFQIFGVLLFFIGLLASSRGELALLIATSAAILSSSLYGKIKFGKIDTGLTLAGTLGGICVGSAGIDHAWVSLLAGIAAGILVPWALILIEVRFRIDDVTGSAATHLVGGLLGATIAIVQTIAGPHDASFSLGSNVLFVLLTLAAGGTISFGIFNSFSKLGKLRISESAEFDGTDLSELDLNTYPDFQQTMIKSYHLREV